MGEQKFSNACERLLEIAIKTRYLGGSFAESHCLGSGFQFELLGSWFIRIALNAVC